jgi:hypothetical protein
MASEEDWLMRPVVEGLCCYESLKDGTLDLEDLARMNDVLNCRDENARRIRASMERE